MTTATQTEFIFANDFRMGITLQDAAALADVSVETIIGLIEEGQLDAFIVNESADATRRHRRVIANSLWRYLERDWRYEPPHKATLRPDEVADLFSISIRQVQRLTKNDSLRARSFGLRRSIRVLRASLDAFIQNRKTIT